MCGGVIKPKTAAKNGLTPQNSELKEGTTKPNCHATSTIVKSFFIFNAKSEKTKTAKISDKIERKINFEIIKPVV